MASKCVARMSHDCGTMKGLQVFEDQDTGDITGFCFSCNTFVRDPLGDKTLDDLPAASRKVKTDQEIEQEIQELSEYPTIKWTERKLSRNSLAHFGITTSVSEEDGQTPIAYHFPYTDGGNLVRIKTRLTQEKRMWSVSKQSAVDLFGWEQAVRTGARRLIITEGEPDAVALYSIVERYTKEQYQDFKPAICSLPNGAASASKDLARLAAKIRRHFQEVVLCFDNDEPGEKAATDCMKIFPDAKTITLPEKDANDCILKGAAKAAFNAITFKAEKRKNTRLVNGKDLHQQARQPAVWGFPWPWEHLNKATRGIRFGETIYIGAAQKMGKSEVVNALAAHFLQYDMPVLLAKPEEANNKSYKMIAGKMVGSVFHDPEVPFDDAAYDRAGEMIGDNLFLINLYQHMGWETLKADIRDAATQGVKAVFIDPITNLTNGMNAADANTKLQEVAQELSAMALDLDIVIFIFCHLRNADNGPDHTRGGAVLSSQFAGSRAMARSCNLMIGIEGNRDPDLTEEERNIRTLSLLEDREFGSVGKFPLYWNKHNTLFTEM